MEIKLVKESERVMIVIGEEKKEFSFDTIDSLIDLLVIDDTELNVITEGEGLENYKKLLEELGKEVKTQNFKSAYEENCKTISVETFSLKRGQNDTH